MVYRCIHVVYYRIGIVNLGNLGRYKQMLMGHPVGRYVYKQNIKHNCFVCGKVYRAYWEKQKYCGKRCNRQASIERHRADRVGYAPIYGAETICTKPNNRKSITDYGWYTYGWYYNGSDLPYYIGYGCNNRAHDKHVGVCKTKDTVVKIFRNGLTREGAMLIESVLIDLFRSLGASLRNSGEPLRRKEVLPLTLEE